MVILESLSPLWGRGSLKHKKNSKIMTNPVSQIMRGCDLNEMPKTLTLLHLENCLFFHGEEGNDRIFSTLPDGGVRVEYWSMAGYPPRVDVFVPKINEPELPSGAMRVDGEPGAWYAVFSGITGIRAALEYAKELT